MDIELKAFHVIDENGKIRPISQAEGPSGMLPHGRCVVRRDNGVIQLEITYHHGVPEGSYRDYWSNSRLASEGSFKDGKQHGTWRFYQPDGSLSEELEFLEGREVRQPLPK